MFKKNLYVAAVLFVALQGNLKATGNIDRYIQTRNYSGNFNGEAPGNTDLYYMAESLNQKSNSPASDSPDENLTPNRGALNFKF